MAYQLIWAPSACLDLKELAAYIAESRPKASVRLVK
jgi:plasmid stabilization system protein ParE